MNINHRHFSLLSSWYLQTKSRSAINCYDLWLVSVFWMSYCINVCNERKWYSVKTFTKQTDRNQCVGTPGELNDTTAQTESLTPLKQIPPLDMIPSHFHLQSILATYHPKILFSIFLSCPSWSSKMAFLTTFPHPTFCSILRLCHPARMTTPPVSWTSPSYHNNRHIKS
jgi:hypothetical protein